MNYTLPALPLPKQAQELVDFCLHFRTVAGFCEQFDRNYATIKHTSQKKRGLRTAAYDLTEQQYQQLFNSGRRYNDRDTFFVAYARHKRRKD